MVDYLFYLCVDILVWLAKVTGTTYELINIIIFIIGYPVFVILLLAIIYVQRKKINISLDTFMDYVITQMTSMI